MTTVDKNRKFSGPITRERQKETGEIFTPESVVALMIDKAGLDFLRIGFKVFEPAAGDGNILFQVLCSKIRHYLYKKRKFKMDSKSITVEFKKSLRYAAASIINDLYACEYMRDNRDAIIQRVKSVFYHKNCDNPTEFEWATKYLPVLERNIAYCNTIDPWDTSEGRKYPDWLFEPSDMIDENTASIWVSMRKASKYYKENPDLHLERDKAADSFLANLSKKEAT